MNADDAKKTVVEIFESAINTEEGVTLGEHMTHLDLLDSALAAALNTALRNLCFVLVENAYTTGFKAGQRGDKPLQPSWSSSPKKLN